MKDLASIVLFTYNRPWHTRQTIEALQQNVLAAESELFIYSDASKDKKSIEKVKEVRSYINTIKGFKKITIIEREKNWGLADSIIDGVTSIVNKYGKIIVLEDDLVTSPYFLKFMNEALDFYKDKKKVWHISGWNYPIDTNGLGDVFLWRLMNCWGWATWADRWKYFEKNTDSLIKNFSKEQITRFNLDGADNFWKQVLANKNGKMNTWAIYWYASIFIKDGLCVNPSKTLVKNVGNDETGVNCPLTKMFDSDINIQEIKLAHDDIIENATALERVKNFYKNQRHYNLKWLINYFIKKCL